MVRALLFFLQFQFLGPLSYAAESDPSNCRALAEGSYAYVQNEKNKLIKWVEYESNRNPNGPVPRLPKIKFSSKEEATAFLGSGALGTLYYSIRVDGFSAVNADGSNLFAEKSKLVRFARLIIESFKAVTPFFSSEQSCAEWMTSEHLNKDSKAFKSFDIRTFYSVLLRAWALRRAEWSTEDLRIFETIFAARSDGSDGFFNSNKSSEPGEKNFSVWRFSGFEGVLPKLSYKRKKAIFDRWLSLVLNEGYSLQEFIVGSSAWNRAETKSFIFWLTSKINLSELNLGFKAETQSTSDDFASRVILALHFKLMPKPQEAKAWVYAELSRRGLASLTSCIGRMLWVELRGLAPQEFRFLWTALVEAQPASTQAQYFSAFRDLGGGAKSALSPLFLIDCLNRAIEDDPYASISMNVFFRDTLTFIARQFSDLSPWEISDLRDTRGSRNVEDQLAILRRRQADLSQRLNSSLVEPYKKLIFSTFNLASSDAVERLRELALDLESTLKGSRTLSQKFHPLRIQAHNQPCPELMRDLISFQALLESTDAHPGLNERKLKRALLQASALIDSVKSYLSIIRYPAERVALGSESEWAKSIQYRVDKMLTRLQEVKALKFSAKTNSQKNLLEQEASNLGIQLYDAFLNVDLDTVVALKDRVTWAKMLLRNLAAEGYVSEEEVAVYLRHSFINSTLRSLGEFLVALEERLLAKVQDELQPLGPKLSEDVLESLVRQTSLRGLSKAVSVFGSWKQINLSFESQSYPVIVLSEGTIQAPLLEGEIELRAQVPLEPVFFKALFLERIPSLSHHVVMKMRALKRPVIVLRGAAKKRLQEKLRALQGQTIEVKATQSEVALRVTDSSAELVRQAFLPLPEPIEGPLGPKGHSLYELSQHPFYAAHIAPFSAVPANSSQEEWLEWARKIRKEFPKESHWHLRSDFDVEDGEVWNAAGVFKSVSFVPIEIDKAVVGAIQSVRAFFSHAALEEIFGQHPLDAGHQYKVLASASRFAAYSGVILVTQAETRIELQQGSGGVVESTDQPETWVGGLLGKLRLVSLQAGHNSILANSRDLIELRKLADQIRVDFPTEEGGWDIEFGVQHSGKVWIHQMRKAF